LQAVRGLISDARAARASVSLHSTERQFYLGVEAAAEEVLRPELANARSDNWLDHELASFREGYLQTTNLLAIALTAAEVPSHLHLPSAP
jgi:hypothetical protein